MRLRLALLLVLGAVAALFVGPVTAAEAYPPTTCGMLSVSTTHPRVGESIVVTGSGFSPNASIRLELHSKVYVLGTVRSDSGGNFTKSVTLPAGVTGNHLIFAFGGTIAGCPVDPSQSLDIQAASTGGTSTGGNSGSGLASTGLDIALLLLVAALMIGVGIALNRRRPAAVQARKSASY